MEKIIIVIGIAKDGTYGAYSENVDGIYGMGCTIEKVKTSALQGLEILRKEAPQQLPPWAVEKDCEIQFKFDTESLLNYYKGIFTPAALSRITGINQRQLQHYASGLKKPRAAQVKKIEAGLHNLAKELLTIDLHV
ncbi:MAG: type II toxin-antitoxin system HicB family antitoxin [Runella sp.]